jgi:cytochrome c biogenesis protein
MPRGPGVLISEQLNPSSALAQLPDGAKGVLQVNDFNIDTRPDGSVAQFYSNLSFTDFQGNELLRREPTNDPFR